MDWYLINSIALSVLFLIVVVSLVSTLRRLNKLQLRFEEQNSKQNLHINALQQRLDSSDKVTLGYQKKLKALEEQHVQLNQSIEQLVNVQSLVEPKLIEVLQQVQEQANALQLIQSESQEQKLYGRAKKMIEMGADVEELITECEIPRAEAELLIRMNSSNS